MVCGQSIMVQSWRCCFGGSAEEWHSLSPPTLSSVHSCDRFWSLGLTIHINCWLFFPHVAESLLRCPLVYLLQKDCGSRRGLVPSLHPLLYPGMDRNLDCFPLPILREDLLLFKDLWIVVHTCLYLHFSVNSSSQSCEVSFLLSLSSSSCALLWLFGSRKVLPSLCNGEGFCMELLTGRLVICI